MATRIMDEAAYKKHQAKFGRGQVTAPDVVAEQRKKNEKMRHEMDAVPMLTKRSKFGNVKTVVDGVKLDSKREAKRYRELGLLLKAGEIDFLARQVRFRLPGGVEYVADFVYGTADVRLKEQIFDLTVEDAKGVRTRDFINKKKQMFSEHGIDVVEV